MKNVRIDDPFITRVLTDEHSVRRPQLRPTIEEEPDPDIRRLIEEESAGPSSLITVHELTTPDPLYDMQLLRDLKIVNERTVWK